MNSQKLFKSIVSDNLVFVTGFTRSGKTLLCPLICSLERAENIVHSAILEQVAILSTIGYMDHESAAYLARYHVNLALYDSFLGRNVNFRPGDYTGAWSYRDPQEYVRRLYTKEGVEVYERIKNVNPINVYMIHNGVWQNQTYFKAFPKVKMFNIIRHPVDIIYSWHTKNYGEDVYESPRMGATTIQTEWGVVPYYALPWAEKFMSLEPMDRIIFMIDYIDDQHNKAYDALDKSHKNQITTIIFEQLAEDTEKVLGHCSDVIGTKFSKDTLSIMKREKCPRVIDEADRKKKWDVISSLASEEGKNIVKRLVDQYEQNAQECFIRV